MSDARAWWRDAVIYQIYPRSFQDSDGDGIGDLEGIRRRLDHLAWLGVDALWLSPIYASPMRDFGYDVADHEAVDPTFGDLSDFDRLVEDAHARGLKVLLDWVPNHTSDLHPWFQESRASRDSGRREWYVWRDGVPGRPPNNWRSQFGGPAWTWDERTSAWYLHLFLPEQPDLNWGNAAVERAMHGVLRFWLDRGVDGFRADVVHLIGKDPTLPDVPVQSPPVGLVGSHDHPSVHPLLRRIRAVLKEYPGERMIVGEVNLRGAARLRPYYGEDDELHLVFNFALVDAPWDAEVWRSAIEDVQRGLLASDAWPTWVLSNHDQSRHRSRYGSEARARTAAMLLLTLPGTPFLYQGEELGLEDAVVPPEQQSDPDGRDPQRAPIPWRRSPGHGWPSVPWLPFPKDSAARSVEAQQSSPTSMLRLYRRLLELRRSTALTRGSFRLLETPPGVLAYAWTHDDETWVVVANFDARARRVRAGLGGWVRLSTQEGSPLHARPWRFDGSVAGETALLLVTGSARPPAGDGASGSRSLRA